MSDRCQYCSFNPTSLSDYCDEHRPHTPHKFTPLSYLIDDQHKTRIEWRADDKWCIIRSNQILNKNNKWEYEPQPSSRTDAFRKRAYFETANRALSFFNTEHTGPENLDR